MSDCCPGAAPTEDARPPLPEHALPPVVPEADWRRAHAELLAEEKALTRARDALAARRRRMPMVRVAGEHRFLGPDGEVDLAGLFDGRRQLVVYRHFFQPGVADHPHDTCGGCRYFTDHVPRTLEHLHARDTTFVMVSPAARPDIAALAARNGWGHIPWYTLLGEEFGREFDVTDWFGLNVFLRDDAGAVYRTYFVGSRGADAFLPTSALLDLTPLGRGEQWEDTPAGRPRPFHSPGDEARARSGGG